MSPRPRPSPTTSSPAPLPPASRLIRPWLAPAWLTPHLHLLDSKLSLLAGCCGGTNPGSRACGFSRWCTGRRRRWGPTSSGSARRGARAAGRSIPHRRSKPASGENRLRWKLVGSASRKEIKNKKIFSLKNYITSVILFCS
jgi:hypothetical protein